MYTGRTIEDLIAAVERAEQQAGLSRLPAIVSPPEVETYVAVSPWNYEWAKKQAVVGVA
ncbi:MAG: hypothetical protein ACE14M_11910 [Terriglobales bacterium]